MLPVRLGNKKERQQQTTGSSSIQLARAISKVTKLLLWGLGSQEDEILISQKYVKGRKKRETEKKKKRLLAESMSTKGGMLR